MTDERDRYAGESARRLHLRLLESELSDAEYLAFCRSHGLAEEVVERLLDLHRPEEAIREATQASGVNTLRLANRLVQHGHPALAEQLVRKDIDHPRGQEARRWLIDRHLARGDCDGALELCLNDYRYRPCLDCFKQVKELARSVDRWDAARPHLLARLRERAVHANDKLEIYVHENMLPEAAELVADPSTQRTISDELLLRTARSLEADFPGHALTIYRANSVVYPDNYDTAAFCLSRMKAIYRRQGRTDEWERYFRPLHKRHKLKRNFLKALRGHNVID